MEALAVAAALALRFNAGYVLLVSPPFVYDRAKAHAAGVAGLLDKPVAGFPIVTR